MTDLNEALNCIDEDLIADAIDTLDARRGTRSRAKAVRWAPAAKGHGRRAGIAIAVSCAAVAVCAVIVLWALLVFTGSGALDPTRMGDCMDSDTFDTYYDYYPDRDMAGRINSLELENAWYELYYNDDTDWTDGTNWFSFFVNGYGSEAVREDGTSCYIHLDVMFTGTVEDWLGKTTFTYGLMTTIIGDTEVTYTTNENAADTPSGSGYSFGYFEKNGALYELTVQYGSSTLEQMMSIFETLLA